MDLSINSKKLQVLDASLPWFGQNIWVRPMTVEPYKDDMNILKNSDLKKNGLETQKSENSSTIFTISSTNNKLVDKEGTNCSTRKTFFNLIRLPDQKNKYRHKFVFKILADENGTSLCALIYKSGPKIKHDKCGASKKIEVLFEDEIEDQDYYLWAISFPYKNNYINTITIGEEFIEFGDITKLYLYNKFYKENLKPELKKILTLQEKPNPEDIFTYDHIQTEWRVNNSKTLTYRANIEIINMLVCVFKFDPNEIYTTPDVIPFVFEKDKKNNIKLVIKISLDTDMGSNTSVIYRRWLIGGISILWAGVFLATLTVPGLIGSALKFYMAAYMLGTSKSNKISDELREKVLNEGIIHPYQLEKLENYQDEIDEVLDEYREETSKANKKGGKSLKNLPKLNKRKTRKNKIMSVSKRKSLSVSKRKS